MTSKAPSKSLPQFVVRFPDGMRERIKESAEQSGRSMNAEIVYRLEQSFLWQDRGGYLRNEQLREAPEKDRLEKTAPQKVKMIGKIHPFETLADEVKWITLRMREIGEALETYDTEAIKEGVKKDKN